MKTARPKLLPIAILFLLGGVALLINGICDLQRTHNLDQTVGFVTGPLFIILGVIGIVCRFRLRKMGPVGQHFFWKMFDQPPPDPYGIIADKIKNPPDIG